ncbi:MAG: hypothetical protein M1503_12155 [Thaumarchaeota archaeon]|nr:hypothetical protein [Nitrososphaerota archaeon]MCL5318994.1 hypothetical protein [Nitrososphaerota archaeon]
MSCPADNKTAIDTARKRIRNEGDGIAAITSIDASTDTNQITVAPCSLGKIFMLWDKRHWLAI